jgi:DNA-binding NarL/FixJ family response regulator
MSVRVLIADDFELVRAGIESALRADPEIEVVSHASDGREALEQARRLRPDVVILDLRMSGQGGMEALDAFREQLPDVRVMILTANANPDNLDAAIAAGAVGYLTKQSSVEDLCEAVGEVHRGGVVLARSLAGRRSPEHALARVADAPSERPTLTGRQRMVVRHISTGLTDAEIAQRLFVSVRTVQYELAEIKRMTGLSRRSEIARWAVINSLG